VRLRTDNYRIAGFVATGLVASILLVPTMAGAQAPSNCGGQAGARDDGATVVGACTGASAPGPVAMPVSAPVGGGAVLSEDERRAAWVSVCGWRGVWQPGATTSLELKRVLTPEDMAALQIEGPPLAVYYRHCVTGGVELGAPVGIDSSFLAPGEEAFPVGAPGVAGAPPVNPLVLRDEARARIRPAQPVFAMSPAGDGSVPAIVNLASWVWLEPGYWAVIPAEQTEGVVVVRVVATPVAVRWVMGDGQVRDCGGPGVAWFRGARVGEGLGECTYVYRHASSVSADGRFHGSMSVTWSYRWWLNGVDQGGFGTSQTAPVPFSVTVDEIEALVD
jgi:hypothetical protein